LCAHPTAILSKCTHGNPMNPDNNSNVIRVPPRRYRVFHKGMHGWVEYHPGTRTWSYKFKYEVKFSLGGQAPTEADAVLQLKIAMDDLAKGGSSIRSTD
jgi:hypothetical protein